MSKTAMALDTNGIAPLFQVYDMPEALAFYRDVLGFEVVSASPDRRLKGGFRTLCGCGSGQPA